MLHGQPETAEEFLVHGEQIDRQCRVTLDLAAFFEKMPSVLQYAGRGAKIGLLPVS